MFTTRIYDKLKKITFLQIFTYIIIIVDIITYLIILKAYQAMNILFISISALLILFYFLVVFKDPTDITIMLQKKARLQNQKFEISNLGYFCDTCVAYVKEKTKHCRKCDICIANFDHHCIWLNYCIGGANYKPFIVLILLLFVFFGIYILQCVLFYRNTTEQQRNQEFFTKYIQSTIALFNLVLMILNFVFILFHFYLIMNNITSYQYIIRNRQKKITPQIQINENIMISEPNLETNHKQIQSEIRKQNSSFDDMKLYVDKTISIIDPTESKKNLQNF